MKQCLIEVSNVVCWVHTHFVPGGELQTNCRVLFQGALSVLMLCALVFIFTSGIVLGVLGLSRSVQRPS